MYIPVIYFLGQAYYVFGGGNIGNLKKFLFSGIILTLSSLIVRILGVSFGVFINKNIGAVGTGLYQLVLNVYSPALTLSTAGIALSSSRLVAEELGKRRNGRWKTVYFRTMAYALCVSVPMTLILFFIAPYASKNWVGSSESTSLIRILALGLPFISLSSCTNGFFTALRRAENSAVLQICEQIFKIILTFSIITYTHSSGINCLIYVGIANVCSDIFSFL